MWKKKSVRVTVAGIFILIIAIIGCIVVQGDGKDREYNAHLETAQKYLSELDYEQAIAEYTAALEIRPNEQSILDALIGAYGNYAQSYVDMEEYERAIMLLEEGIKQTQSEVLSARRDMISEVWEERKVIQMNADVFEKLFHWFEQEAFHAISSYMQVDEMEDVLRQNMSRGGTITYSENGEMQMQVVWLNPQFGGLYLYYGELDGTIREGKGIWLQAINYNGSYIIYQGEWKNGMPNGQGKVTTVYYNEGQIFSRETEYGSYKDGLENGRMKGEREYFDGSGLYFEYEYSSDEGKRSRIESDSEGDSYEYAIGYNREGIIEAGLSVSPGEKCGVPGWMEVY